MKKTLALFGFLAFASLAMADGNYASVKAEYRNGRDNSQDATAYGLTVGQNINKYLDGEVYARVKSNEDRTNNTRAEVALVGKYAIDPKLSVYTRGAVGQMFTGTTNDSYWSVEPGVKYAVTSNLDVKAGVRFRDAFTNNYADSTRTYRLGSEYAFTKTSSVILGYDRSLGDSKYDALSIGYGIKF